MGRNSLSDGFVAGMSHHSKIFRAKIPIYYIEQIPWRGHTGGKCHAGSGIDRCANSISLGFPVCPLTLPCVENH